MFLKWARGDDDDQVPRLSESPPSVGAHVSSSFHLLWDQIKDLTCTPVFKITMHQKEQ